MKPPEVLSRLDTDRARGLSSGEAERRLEQYGPNRLQEAKGDSLPLRFFRQLKDPMIIVLLAAAAVSLLSSGGRDWVEALIILVIVLVNAAISISQENSAARALEALRKMSAPQARVLRDGGHTRVDAALLVPGDIILLEAGDLVPTDARILECVNLKADESAMTGESVPVSKQAVDSLPEETPLGDRRNMVIASTVITNGRATCVVTDTGMNTQVGHIARMLTDQQETDTPLQRKMGEISRILSFACLGVCAVMFGVGLLYGKGLLEMFMTAVSLAVAAIPEGLPAIVTIVLALGVQRMARYHAVVKRLPAVETLGCAGVICSDKTGTLTMNKMTVVEVWSPGQAHKTEALTLACLCNDTILSYAPDGSPHTAGDPTEVAFVEAAFKEGLDKNTLEAAMPRVAELPFESQRKLMSTVHRVDGKLRIVVKGAPDVLLSRCTHMLSGGPVPLTPARRQEAERVNADMAKRALRVLATAYRDVDRLPSGELTTENLERELTFVGLIGMIDPPREEVKQAVAACYGAGIRPVMITGDHKLTAVAIAKELNIFREGDLAITGEDLDFMSPEMLEHDVDKFSVYARVSPEHKMRIVRAWQKRGMVVAMTGDGVNDAPALKSADIGCAMGLTGTDVAKGAADMILTDDNFSTIVRAVEQGRGIYSNISKSIHYLLSCNIGEILVLFLATLFHFHQDPLTPVQLLWLNLVTDSLPALALGMEPVEHAVMEEKPRAAGESLFNRAFSLRLAWQGAMVGLLTLAAYYLGEYVLSDPTLADATANTMAFATLTFCQLVHAFDVRSEHRSLFEMGFFSNPAINKAFLAGMFLQLSVLLFPPLMGVFGVSFLSPVQWLWVLGLSLCPLLLCEGEKALRRKLRPRGGERQR
ncbi:MAG: calcium-translocating P-type ATPase, PMCA-type [Oscillospiraceae bacterium]|nr:calcium-translocating P-type ATPase, PMCA-type [Oscillospiraceae bacterium]